MDSIKTETYADAKKTLFNLLSNKDLNEIPIAIVANKQDDLCALGVNFIRKALYLDKIEDREYEIFKVSSITGDGIENLKNWIYNNL